MLIDPLDMSCYVWSFNKRKILHQEKPSNKLNSNHDEESTWQSIRNSLFQIRFQRKNIKQRQLRLMMTLEIILTWSIKLKCIWSLLLVSRIRFCQCHRFKSSLPRPLTPLLPLNFQTSVIRLRIKFNCTMIDVRYCGQIIKITQR